MTTSKQAPRKRKDEAKGGRSLRGAGLELKRERTRFEWVLLGVALAAIGAVITGLFFYADQRAGGEAALVVEVQDTGELYEGGPEIELTVRNTGGAGAEEVVTEVSMGSEIREVSMVRIPKDDEATAIVVFPPGTTGTPEARLLSYVQT